ncbi:MAG: phosphoglucosamine mutase [Ponticaulis sp.]|nr:phosphoglucosamine mutase [Ponticaulis sp.]|tara:strand:+ start:41439 stop:42800 length:1362 start_codon:yes stop_codon:yes gene_type:complete
MTDRLFGTDGIRGRVNTNAIRPHMFVRFGEALGSVLKSQSSRPQVLIGRDTRQSGHMIEAAIEAGLFNAGASTIRGGVLPTPAVGCLVPQIGADAGLMITASHNPPEDNGVKVFGADGFKLSAEQQTELEALIQNMSADLFADVGLMGAPENRYELSQIYVDFAKKTFSSSGSLSGLRICLDAANGAASGVAESVFAELGAEIVSSIASSPDGRNINAGCGAMHPEKLQDSVSQTNADIGIAFDGDADRIVIVNEKAEIVDGDQIMGAIGLEYARRGALRGNTVVSTIMSNMGLEFALAEQGISLERTKVGDRYVVERMREGGFVVGGEQSGHIILTDYVTTGDAIISALKILGIMTTENRAASEVLSVFEPVPQILKNIRYSSSDPLADTSVVAELTSVTENLGKTGRIVVRKSGTEPVIRVMAEAVEHDDAENAVDRLIGAISDADERAGK